MAFQLTRRGLDRPGADEVRAWRAAYAAESCIRIPAFLEPALVDRVQQRLTGAVWQEFVHRKVEPPAPELILGEGVVPGLLGAVTRDPALFDVIRAITGCDPIGSFGGRVYRMDPGGGHHDSWHDDARAENGQINRLVALSLNLSPGVYAGGVLEIRRRGSDQPMHRVANTGPGDAVLFRIDPALEHRVSNVEGSVSKIAWAGWFQREPRLDLGGLVRSSAAW